MKFRIQNEELRIVSRGACGLFSSNRTLYVPFRPHVVILSVSEESSHWKGQAVVLVEKQFS